MSERRTIFESGKIEVPDGIIEAFELKDGDTLIWSKKNGDQWQFKKEAVRKILIGELRKIDIQELLPEKYRKILDQAFKE